jgi:hypothetical protein
VYFLFYPDCHRIEFWEVPLLEEAVRSAQTVQTVPLGLS